MRRYTPGMRPSIEPMDYPVGKHFFHYTTRAAAFGDIVPMHRLRFSTYERMRDPLENRDWMITGAYWPSTFRSVGSAERTYMEFRQLARAIRRQARILAVTIDAPDAASDRPFSRGWSRARMWEHYAEKHEGVCLMFNRERLLSNLDGRVMYQGEVEYTEEGNADLSLNLSADKADALRSPEGVAAYVEANSEDLFFLKTLDWETEHEYRFVTLNTGDPQDELFLDFGDALDAVIVGERFPTWERPAAIDACREAHVDALTLNWDMRRPIVTFLKVYRPHDPENDPTELRKRLLREEPLRPPAP